MEALRQGEIAAVMGPMAQLEYGLDDSLLVHTPPLPGLTIGEWTLGIAVRHNYRQLAYAVMMRSVWLLKMAGLGKSLRLMA